jgi:hypothetical protein
VTHLSNLLQRCKTSSTSTSGCGGLNSPTTKLNEVCPTIADVCQPTEHRSSPTGSMLAPIAGYCYPITAPNASASASASTVTTAGSADSTLNIACVSRP